MIEERLRAGTNGALARVTGAASVFGAFFDSFPDRYVGLLVYYAGGGRSRASRPRLPPQSGR